MIKKVSVQEFDAIYEIMSVSFPRCERRTKDGQKALFSLANYTVYGWYEQKRICAFLAAYTLDQWRFVEHLATDQTFAQPSFHGENAVPLCLMVNDKHLKTDDLRAIQRSLYQDVYHLDISNII